MVSRSLTEPALGKDAQRVYLSVSTSGCSARTDMASHAQRLIHFGLDLVADHMGQCHFDDMISRHLFGIC
jgi:hypothetical protein